MRRLTEIPRWAVALLAAAAIGGCGGGDDSGPSSTATIAKTTTKSGDAQTGPASQALPEVLRVVVTQNGSPAPNVMITWAAGSGSVAPVTQPTDDQGVSTTTWTLGDTPGTQTATASLSGASGSPVEFTATATGPGPAGTVVEVRSPDGNGGYRFDPADITVTAGTTVTWDWAPGAAGHNVVPDDGSTPAASGDLASAPHQYQFTFTTPGTYHYHCQAHQAVGMVGTVTVTEQQ
ncbi:MAG: plastocyanin/azurin family copper-binding protein [Gemmatimonadales bacterium]